MHEPAGVNDALSDGENPVFVAVDVAIETVEQTFMLIST
jgi:hypothetical protein